MKYVCCVCERDVVMKLKIRDSQPMQRMSKCKVRFGHYGRSFIYPEMYKSALTKRITMPGSMF